MNSLTSLIVAHHLLQKSKHLHPILLMVMLTLQRKLMSQYQKQTKPRKQESKGKEEGRWEQNLQHHYYWLLARNDVP